MTAFRPVIRWTIASAVGVAVSLCALGVGFFGQGVVADVADRILARHDTAAADVVSVATTRDFYMVAGYGLAVACGILTTLIVGSGFKRYTTRRLAYLVIFMVLLPLTVYNYAHEDYIVRPAVQVWINLALMFCGVLLAVDVSLADARAPDARMLRTLLVAVVTYCAVYVPMLLNLAYFALTMNIVSVQQANELVSNHVVSVSGVLAAVTALLASFSGKTKSRARH